MPRSKGNKIPALSKSYRQNKYRRFLIDPTSRTLSMLRLLPREMLFSGPSSGSLAWSSHRSACILRRWDSLSSPASHASFGLRTTAWLASEARMRVPLSRRNASRLARLGAWAAGATGAAVSAMMRCVLAKGRSTVHGLGCKSKGNRYNNK